jgi:hypothetical protein
MITQFVDNLDETRLERIFEGAWPRQIDRAGFQDMSRTRAHDVNRLREIYRFAQLMRYQDDRAFAERP